MAEIKPFRCLRPCPESAARVASLPYDIYSGSEARREAGKDPYRFLNIDRPETLFEEETDPYSDAVYRKAGERLAEQIRDGIYLQDSEDCYYLYELCRNGRIQTGIVGCAAVSDFSTGVIRAHEETRKEKEQDRFRHILACRAQTGPVFLLCRKQEELKKLVAEEKRKPPLYAFTSEDGVSHRVFRIPEKWKQQQITEALRKISRVYIADGHHRAAAAASAAGWYQAQGVFHRTDEYNSVLSVLFFEDEVTIYPYYRAVRELGELTEESLIQKLTERFTVQRVLKPVKPEEKGVFGLCLPNGWYRLTKRSSGRSENPVRELDVSVLQEEILNPILGILNPRTDPRLEFISGVQGVCELERRVAAGLAAAFSLYPVSVRELFAAADQGACLPPKSTWFEPKLRSGLFLHVLE